MTQPHWKMVVLIPWFFCFAWGLGWEILGSLNPKYPTFTAIVRDYVPMFVVWIAWWTLFWHFILRYYLPTPHYAKSSLPH